MIDDQVDEKFGASGVNRDSQFAKLVHAGCALVKFHESRIDGSQILAGVGAAIAAKPGLDGGRRIDGQQQKNATAEIVEDVRQFGLQITQGS